MLMKKIKNFKRFRMLFLVLVVLLFWAFNYYPCISLDLTSLPEKILHNGKHFTDVLFLYGSGICTSCTSGKYVYSLKDREDIVFVVPSTYTQYDLENFNDIFMLKGKVIKGDEEIAKLVNKINLCKERDMWKANYHIKFGKNGRIKSIIGL